MASKMDNVMDSPRHTRNSGFSPPNTAAPRTTPRCSSCFTVFAHADNIMDSDSGRRGWVGSGLGKMVVEWQGQTHQAHTTCYQDANKNVKGIKIQKPNTHTKSAATHRLPAANPMSPLRGTQSSSWLHLVKTIRGDTQVQCTMTRVVFFAAAKAR